MSNKKYKAAIFDMDGTLVPIDPNAVPSSEVVSAIHAAHEFAYIGVATGRSRIHALPVMHMLNIINPSVLFGGAQIVDPVTEKIIWEKLLSITQLQGIEAVFEEHKTPQSRVFVGDLDDTQLTDYVPTDKPTHGMSLVELPLEKQAEIHNQINAISGVSGHIMDSWYGSYDIAISHAEGDKEHGVKQLLALQSIDPADILVAGDSSNDMPLFAVGGFRIAMGNATDELKSMADYIAPTITEDGVAHIIKKFILPD